MIYNLIETLLKEKTGLHSASIGSESIKTNIKRRMEICSIFEVSDYYALLNQSQDELQLLINETMVPETWFFRDDIPFNFLKSFINNQWLPTRGKKRLRILNIPCATGEEPYSVAMILLECGMKAQQFSIDAVDINTWVLDYAEKGSYSQHSFRGNVIDQYQHYFTKKQGRYQLNDTVKKAVSFNYGNVLDDGFIMKSGVYDIVFCRNLLIYFDDETKKKVVRHLCQLLIDKGVLFVGYADVSALTNQLFTPVSYPRAFAFYKQEPIKLKSVTSAIQQYPSRRLCKNSFESLRKDEVLQTKKTDDTHVFDDKEVMERIQKLADQGELHEAKTLCQKFLEKNSVSISAHYLMGVILDVQGEWDKAHDLFCKTLYLNPKHYEALTYLAIYAERRGDSTAAKVYRSRAARIAEQKAGLIL